MRHGKNPPIGQIVAETPAAARVFDEYRIDYCSEGKDPLDVACRKVGVLRDRIVEEIELAARTEIPTDLHDWHRAPMRDLIAHILNAHHAYLDAQLPLLEHEIMRSVGLHASEDNATYRRLRDVFARFRSEIEHHNKQEEMILFPTIIALEQASAKSHFGPKSHYGFAAQSIHSMEGEHESIHALLREIRSITNSFTPPSGANGQDRSLYHDLHDFELNMRRHFHLENNILFPRAAALEENRI
jgi:regulator of cell morphogenesis and NO signaling